MKDTGVVRKIDRLGRVVIPKDILRRFCIRENDPLDISMTEDEIIIRKHKITRSEDDKAMFVFENIVTVLERNGHKYGKDFCVYRILESIHELPAKSIFPVSVPDEWRKWKKTDSQPAIDKMVLSNPKTDEIKTVHYIPIFCEGLEGFISFIAEEDKIEDASIFIGAIAAMAELELGV